MPQYAHLKAFRQAAAQQPLPHQSPTFVTSTRGPVATSFFWYARVFYCRDCSKSLQGHPSTNASDRTIQYCVFRIRYQTRGCVSRARTNHNVPVTSFSACLLERPRISSPRVSYVRIAAGVYCNLTKVLYRARWSLVVHHPKSDSVQTR